MAIEKLITTMDGYAVYEMVGAMAIMLCIILMVGWLVYMCVRDFIKFIYSAFTLSWDLNLEGKDPYTHERKRLYVNANYGNSCPECKRMLYGYKQSLGIDHLSCACGVKWTLCPTTGQIAFGHHEYVAGVHPTIYRTDQELNYVS